MRTFHFAAVLYLLSARRARTAYTLGVVEGFFDYNFPKLELIWMEPWIYVMGHCAHSRKKMGEIAPEVPPKGTKTCFVSERELTFTFDICYRPSAWLSSVCRLSSVTLVHPTQAVEIYGNISTAFDMLAISWHPQKILRRSSYLLLHACVGL